VTAEINALSFSPVGEDLDRESDDFWQSSTQDVQVDDRIIDIFERYISTIINKPDTNQISVGRFDGDDQSKEYLDEMLALELAMSEDPGGYDRFEELSKTFASKLMNIMRNTANTNDGIFFVIHGTWYGEPLISMMKLEPQDEERSVIDEDARELRYEELDDALPDPDNFQKGCVFPLFEAENFNKSGHIKFLEDDGPTKYFPQFLGCDVGQGSRKQFKNTLKVIGEMKESDPAESMSSNDIQYFYDAVTADGEMTETQVKRAASDIIGHRYDEDELERRLYEEGEEHISSDPEFAPSKVEWTIDGEIKLRVPVHLLDSDQVQISEPEHNQDEWKAVIEGLDVENDYKE
jgi:hypothetical protein